MQITMCGLQHNKEQVMQEMVQYKSCFWQKKIYFSPFREHDFSVRSLQYVIKEIISQSVDDALAYIY